MSDKPLQQTGNLKKFPDSKIYINVENLKKGCYELYIINKSKLIKRTSFKKK